MAYPAVRSGGRFHCGLGHLGEIGGLTAIPPLNYTPLLSDPRERALRGAFFIFLP